MFRETVLAFMGVKDKPAAGGCDEKQKAKCKIEFGEHLKWTCSQCEKNSSNGSNRLNS